MAKRSKTKKAPPPTAPPVSPAPKKSPPGPPSPVFRLSLSDLWPPLLLALLAFCVYAPSLRSDFVYDAHSEIVDEGFVTSLANLPAVLSLKVLGMNLRGKRDWHVAGKVLRATSRTSNLNGSRK